MGPGMTRGRRAWSGQLRDFPRLEWSGVERGGMELRGVEWNGVESSGVCCGGDLRSGRRSRSNRGGMWVLVCASPQIIGRPISTSTCEPHSLDKPTLGWRLGRKWPAT
jgi:hypothetical protein